MNQEYPHSHSVLVQFTKDIFQAMGSPADHAIQAAEVLLEADLRGVDSHGVARLKGYVRLWENQRINANPLPKVVHETPGTAVLDGDEGMGLVVAPEAMKIAMEKARNCGTGWVGVRNSNHFGIAGYHSMLALEEGMIGFAMTNASPLVAPTYCSERLLGTNPIAVAIPAGKYPPFVADFATTTVANGKLEIMKRKQAAIPIGWAQDSFGDPSESADCVAQGGALLPLGGSRNMGSHKGYCLGSIVDILSGVLTGANFGPWVPPFVSFLDPPTDPVGKGIGHFLGAMRIDAFLPAQDFKDRMDQWISRFKNADTTREHHRVLIPGDPEREMRKHRLEHGIPLLEPVRRDLEKLAQRFELKPPDMLKV